MHSYLFSFRPHALARGLSIGMFWACMPMPFQMLPALLFCWLGLANLPIALLCVWISNPFTYLPIFYFEYEVGVLLFHAGEHTIMPFSEFSSGYKDIFKAVGGVYGIVLEGALVVGTVSALIAYFIGFPLSNYLESFVRRRRRRKEQNADAG